MKKNKDKDRNPNFTPANLEKSERLHRRMQAIDEDEEIPEDEFKREVNGRPVHPEVDFEPEPLTDKNILDFTQHDDFDIYLGKRRAGKTTALRWVLQQADLYKIYTEVYVFTDTAQNLQYTIHAPNTRIYNGLGDESIHILKSIIERQKQKVNTILQYLHAHKSKVRHLPFSPLILIILDDVLKDTKILSRHNELLNELVYDGRHLYISLKMLLQDPTGAPPAWRLNADKVFASFSTQKRFVKYLHEGYFPFVPLNDFLHFYHNNTKDFKMLVFNMNKKMDDIQKVVHTILPDPDSIEQYTIGLPYFWEESRCSPELQKEYYKGMKKLTAMKLDDFKTQAKRDTSKYWKTRERERKKIRKNDEYIPDPLQDADNPKVEIEVSPWSAENVVPATLKTSKYRYFKGV